MTTFTKGSLVNMVAKISSVLNIYKTLLKILYNIYKIVEGNGKVQKYCVLFLPKLYFGMLCNHLTALWPYIRRER